jgi:hypothetical protein
VGSRSLSKIQQISFDRTHTAHSSTQHAHSSRGHLQQQINGSVGISSKLACVCLSPATNRRLPRLNAAGFQSGLFRSASSSAQRGWISERSLLVCVLFSTSLAPIPLVVIANAEKHNYHKNQKIQMQATKTQRFTWFTQRLGYVHQA